jgi:hypothetical protein
MIEERGLSVVGILTEVGLHRHFGLTEIALYVFGWQEKLPLLADLLRSCYSLWDLADERLWPSRVRPSGFQAVPEYVPAPSGYVRDPAGTTLWDLEG